MAGEHSPSLDRHVQEDIGRALREAGSDRDETTLPDDIAQLLEDLKLRERAS